MTLIHKALQFALLSIPLSLAAADTPTLAISTGVGIAAWPGYAPPNQYGTENKSVTGEAIGIVIKKPIAEDYDLVMSASEATEFCLWCGYDPINKMDIFSVQGEFTKWWKYGYISGAAGFAILARSGPGDRKTNTGDCSDSFWCHSEYEQVSERLPGLSSSFDVGAKFKFFGMGMRTDYTLTKYGNVFMLQAHLDLII